MSAYYNEIDPFAAQWIRELIKAGHIAPGIVDERSIEDVEANDLDGFTQCHFFAGIGVWSYALRLAGWPDDRPVWSGSCPCQSFSSAGKGAGFKDPRHLWPAFYNLIDKCRPVTVFGEQVEAAIRHGWLDLLQLDLERSGYAAGATVFPACGIGAPHIRKRLYWVASRLANSQQPGSQGLVGPGNVELLGAAGQARPVREGLSSGRLGYTEGDGREPWRPEPGRPERAAASSASFWLAHSISNQEHEEQHRPTSDEGERCADELGGSGMVDASTTPRQTNGIWRDVDWLFCRDGKWRPVESRLEPLADGLADRLGYHKFSDRYSLDPLIKKAENRAGRLRGYGNAIVAPQAAAFIGAFMEWEI